MTWLASNLDDKQRVTGALAGGAEAFKQRVADPEQRARMEKDMWRIFEIDRVGHDISRVQFRVLRSDIVPDPIGGGHLYVLAERPPGESA